MTLERFLPIPEASARWKISELHLRALVQSGKIRGGILSNGEVVVNEQDTRARVPKEELPEYKKHARLRGVEISISGAAEKYHVPFSTLRGWVIKGYISQIGQEGRRVLLDEADAAYCAEIYYQRGGQGRWLFSPDGTPYTKALA